MEQKEYRQRQLPPVVKEQRMIKVQGVHFYGFKPIVADTTSMYSINKVDIVRFERSFINTTNTNTFRAAVEPINQRQMQQYQQEQLLKLQQIQQQNQYNQYNQPYQRQNLPKHQILDETYNILANYNEPKKKTNIKPSFGTPPVKYTPEKNRFWELINLRDIGLIAIIVVLVYFIYQFL